MSGRRTVDGPLDGVRWVVDERGQGNGPVVVWLHSEWGMLDGVEEPRLTDLDARVVVPHLPGWGESTGGEAFQTLVDLAVAMWWLLDELGHDQPVTLAGLGLGGALAAEMAVLAPRRTARLVLVNPAGIWDDAIGGADTFALLPKDITPHLYADVDGDAAAAHFPRAADAHDKAMAGVRRAQVLGPASRYLYPLPDTGIARRLYRLSGQEGVPTDLVWGAGNGVLPVALAERWTELVPHARVLVVEEAAHMLAHEAPERLEEVLLASEPRTR